MNFEYYKQYLFHPKSDKYNLLGILKQEGDFNKIKKILSQLSSHPFIKSIIQSNIKPLSYDSIRKSRSPNFSGNLIGELTWHVLVFEKNKKIIEEFIRLKEIYEKKFLLGEYDDAEKILTEIEAVSGKSIWLIENLLILKEYKSGVGENWNAVSDFSKNIKDPFILFLIENLSKRAESKISYFRYRNIFSNQINEILVPKPLFEYLTFRLNYHALNSYENLSYILHLESFSSLVDRYLLTKDVLAEMLSKKFKEQRDTLIFFSKKLHELFPNDPQLRQILCLFSPELIQSFTTSPKIFELINEYSKGNYTYCINNAPSLIRENPTIIECYEIFVKSMIEEGKSFVDLNISHNINTLIDILFNIYSDSEKFEQSLDAGFKIATTFSSTSWSRQFISLIRSTNSTNNGNKLFTVQYLIYSQIKNPRILYYNFKNSFEQYFNSFKDDSALVETTHLLKDILSGNSKALQENSKISIKRKAIYIGRALIREGKLEEAKSHFEKLISQESLSILSKEESIVNLYRCYLKLNLIKEACCLFVEYYLLNSQITKRLNRQKLLNTLEEGQIESVKELIELPIFYRIASFDSYQQYVAYDTYLESLNISRPQQLIEKCTVFDTKIIYFLKEVCTIEIMHHSYHFMGTDDIEGERLQILSKLIVVDKQNEDNYIKEITELNQNSKIRRAIREVNKGRISINVQQLRNNETTNIKEAFTRFKEIETYAKNKDIIGIDASLNMLSELTKTSLDDLISNKIVYTNDPAFISFKVIFVEIRDKFILSKEYGLDGYLSTRIRHGALLNHIRSVFESQNIISQRDKENNYQDNEFWNQAIPFNLVEKRSQIQNAIKKFSKSIDEYTEFVVKELIQVKTEKYTKKSNALFDFSLGNKELALLFTVARENIKDHNAFLGFIFEYLQKFTENLLSKIREKVISDIKKKYDKILQDFNTEIKEILKTTNFPELTSSISLCGTRLQNELKNISEWFYLSNSSKDLVLDLKVLIQTAVQITNTIYPNYKLNPTIEEKHSVPMEGTIHLIYICRILLDNIILHSKLSSNELSVRIYTETINDELLQIKFVNNLSNEVDAFALEKKFSAVKEKWGSSSDDFENIDIEGGSGFDKIRRIVVFDLGCEVYQFNYKIENNTIEISLTFDFVNLPKYEEEN